MAAVKSNAEKQMAEMETVFVPKEGREDDTLYVSLNGRTFLIPKGKSVEVPKPVAAIIHASQEAQRKADEFIEEQQRVLRDSEKNPMGV